MIAVLAAVWPLLVTLTLAAVVILAVTAWLEHHDL